MAFQQGLSGLNAASRNLEVIGNNVANSNTTGAKISRVHFGDVYANSLSGSAGGGGGGIGVSATSVTQEFTQGQLETTNNPLDLAINGRGFFRLTDNGTVGYSRSGEFSLDKDGYITNPGGARLSGYPVNPGTGQIDSGAPRDLRIGQSDIAPTPTVNASVTANLDAGAAATTFGGTPGAYTGYSGSTSLAVYDSLGQDHTVSMYFSRDSANGTAWSVNASVDGGAASTLGKVGFDSAGRFGSATLTPFTFTPSNGSGAMSVTFDLGELTQFAQPFDVTALSQDGAPSGRLSGFTIGENGMIGGRYSNGKSAPLGQVVLVNFTNPQGLVSVGGNMYAETPASGQPLVGAPDSGTLGVIEAGALEGSNIDLTKELVSMITAQRTYQANAQTIRTQDQVLQTLVNLR